MIAERAHSGTDVTKADLEDVLAEARGKAEAAAAEDKDGAEKFVADIVALLDAMD